MIVRMIISNNKHCAFNRTTVYYILTWFFSYAFNETVYIYLNLFD